MHQFEVQTIAPLFNVGEQTVYLTNSAVWMLATFVLLWVFMLGGMKRELVPGRWQAAVEGFTGFMGASWFHEEGSQRVPFSTDERSFFAEQPARENTIAKAASRWRRVPTVSRSR